MSLFRLSANRFANHSCEPNCSVERWIVDDYTRVGLFAIQDIEAYTELTFDYNYTYASTEKIKCLCGTAKCREFIGERRLSDRQKATEKRAFESSSETAGEQKEHSDVCFSCLNEDDTVTDNVLLMCDYHSCTHSWHPSCVGLDSIPSGDWICPGRFEILLHTNNIISLTLSPLSLSLNLKFMTTSP